MAPRKFKVIEEYYDHMGNRVQIRMDQWGDKEKVMVGSRTTPRSKARVKKEAKWDAWNDYEPPTPVIKPPEDTRPYASWLNKEVRLVCKKALAI